MTSETWHIFSYVERSLSRQTGVAHGLLEMLFPFGGIAPLSVVGLSTLPEPPQLE